MDEADGTAEGASASADGTAYGAAAQGDKPDDAAAQGDKPAAPRASAAPAAATADAPTDAEAAGGAVPARSRRRLFLAVGATLTLGIFVGGVGTGWWAADRWSPRSAPEVVVAAPSPGAGAKESSTMPDVRGLSTADARQVLADLGFGDATVTVKEQPWVGAPGSVVAQEPAGGEPATGAITLVVAAPAVIPPIVGTDVNEAARALQALGAEVVVRRVYRDGTPTDQVVDVTPVAGQPVPAKVVVTASAPPATVDLTELRAAESGCGTDQNLQVNGEAVAKALTCRAGSDPNRAVYLLGRRIARLTAVLGQPDTVEPGLTVRFEVVGDGKVLASATLSYGQSKSVDVPTKGVLRLELRVSLQPTPKTCCPSTTAAFGNVQLVGGAAEVAALRELNP